MTEIIFTNGQIILDNEVITGTVVVTNGEISQIASEISHVSDAIDLDNDYLMPGLVELHTDNMERHLMPRNSIQWPCFAAAVAHDCQVTGAGMTTVFNALSVGDIAEFSGRIKYFDEMVNGLTDANNHGSLRADHRLHLRCEASFPALARETGNS